MVGDDDGTWADTLELNERFLNAVKNGNIDLARQLLSANADPHAKTDDFFKSTALHFAAVAEQNSAQLIRMLAVELKTDVELVDAYDSRPLHMAAGAGNREAVELLLDLRAEPNALGFNKTSALQEACRSGSVACVQALLSARADVEHVDDCGQSMLFDAAMAPMAPAPDPDPDVAHVLEYCVEKNLVDIRGAGKHAVDKDGGTLLYYAALFGRLRALKLLLELKCDSEVNRISSGLRDPTPLLAAARSMCKMEPPEEAHQCVEALLAANADVGAKNPEGENVLHIAARSGNAALISLVAHAEERQICGSSGADHGGTGGGECAATGVGVGAGAGAPPSAGMRTRIRDIIEARDSDGLTPLLRAVYRCETQAARALLALGADAEAKTTVYKISHSLFRCILFYFYLLPLSQKREQ